MQDWGEATMLSLFPRSSGDQAMARRKLATAPGGFPHISGCSFLPSTISRVSLLPAPCYPLAALAMTAAPSLNLTTKGSICGYIHLYGAVVTVSWGVTAPRWHTQHGQAVPHWGFLVFFPRSSA